MKIANPIYDVVFKFMMEDETVAKSFLSAIIGEEVLELNFSAQEHTIHKPPQKVAKQGETINLTVCRFDFSAKISLPDGGFKTVLVELQKAKFPSDIMRFRRYVGLHYKNPSNSYFVEDEKKARQIYCISLLGYDIGIPESPILQIDNTVIDVSTKKQLSASDNEFIQALHHRSWIVQLEQLKQHRRNDIEKLLSVFDQDNRIKDDEHIMIVNEMDFPEIYRPIVRRLRMAYEDEQVQIEMEMEDEYIEDILNRERLIAKKDKALKEKDRTLKEKDNTLKEKNKTIEKQKKTIHNLIKQLEKSRKRQKITN
jgi:uncharacterized coiled-coil protein SlyX